MKTRNPFIIVTVMALMLIATAAFGQSTQGPGSETDAKSIAYMTGAKSDEVLQPTGFALGADKNVYSLVLQPVVNPDSEMMKRALVQSGDGQVWEFLSDEASRENRATYQVPAPNPLSYLVAGSSLNLLSRLEKTAKDMSLEIDDITVEQEFIFELNKLVASIAKVTTSILVESREDAKVLASLKETALREWVVGEGLGNKTKIEGVLLINGTNFDVLKKHAGHVVADSELVQRTDRAINPVTIEVPERKGDRPPKGGPDNNNQKGGMGGPPEFLSIQLTSVAKSAHDENKPYLNTATIAQTRWSFTADDADLYGGVSSLPNSLHHYTVGTAFCLGTQMTLTNGLLRQNLNDMRIEQQFVFGDKSLDSLKTVLAADTQKSQKETEEWFNLSLSMCFAGAGIKNATPLINSFYINGDIVK